MVRAALAMLVFAAAAPAARAQEFGDPDAGLRLAREVCASCHAVGPGQIRSPSSEAATFEQIANVPGMTPTALTVALRTSHRTMPALTFEAQELSDLIAYITSLRR